jgi:hypothetical protein
MEEGIISGGEESLGSPRIMRPNTSQATGGRGKKIISEVVHKITPN